MKHQHQVNNIHMVLKPFMRWACVRIIIIRRIIKYMYIDKIKSDDGSGPGQATSAQYEITDGLCVSSPGTLRRETT